jgi:hypothetical protein
MFIQKVTASGVTLSQLEDQPFYANGLIAIGNPHDSSLDRIQIPFPR